MIGRPVRGHLRALVRSTMNATRTPAVDSLFVATGRAFGSYPLPAKARITIGRASDCDVCIDDPSVSRRHAILHLGPVLRIEDAGSRNGTRVRRHDPTVAPAGDETDASSTSERRLHPGEAMDVAPGMLIQFGSIVTLLRSPGPAAPPMPASVPRTAKGLEDLVVCDRRTIALHDLVARVADSATTVLLLGETGVGKEVVAAQIHALSRRAERRLVQINCAAMPETLLESELFGYEQGAFTGANREKAGLLETADGGTLMLDEIGELPLPTQAKLLRVLEDGCVTRLGARAPKRVDVRFVAATNRDLDREVAAGTFRRDLLFRLNVFPLVIPPLRERRLEIEPLARAFVRQLSQRAQREPPALDPDALAILEAYAWPGNVRELRNVIERALVLCGAGPIAAPHLPLERLQPGYAKDEPAPPAPQAAPMPAASSQAHAQATIPCGPASVAPRELWASVEELERERILGALNECAGNQTRAAKQLGVSRRLLVKRLEAYGVPRPRKPR
jgi:DNA-binding NtrC family response regulator